MELGSGSGTVQTPLQQPLPSVNTTVSKADLGKREVDNTAIINGEMETEWVKKGRVEKGLVWCC